MNGWESQEVGQSLVQDYSRNKREHTQSECVDMGSVLFLSFMLELILSDRTGNRIFIPKVKG